MPDRRNASLRWFRTDTGADVGKTPSWTNGVTYVTEPFEMPKEVALGDMSFRQEFAASSAGTLTLERSTTPEADNNGQNFTGAAPLPCRWSTYAPPGWSIPVIAGADVVSGDVSQAGGVDRWRLKFVPTATAGSNVTTEMAVA